MSAVSNATRPIFLTREGDHFRLAFSYDEALVARARTLPYAVFDRTGTRTWTALVCTQSVEALREMFYEGLVDVSVDSLIEDGETITPCTPALLRAGSRNRPFVVQTAVRDDNLYSRLRSIPGASWDKRLNGVTYPPTAAAALAELADRGVISDPERLLRPADTTITFDVRSGRFRVMGDPRAQASFDLNFPKKDVVAAWQSKGLDVAFADPFSEEVYKGELARAGEGLQPAGLLLPLFDYQARTVAYALSRSGVGVWHSPGLGKTPIGVAVGYELLQRGTVNRVVVFCPGGLRTQWREEITRFTGHDDVIVVDGSAQKRANAYAAAQHARWLVVNYDVLTRDLEQLEPLCKGASIIADEAHRLKSPTSKRTKSARKLAKYATHRLALSGTPVESRPDEWYWTTTWAVPNALGDAQDFLNRHMFPNRWNGFEGARNLDELRRRSLPHFIRFTKQQVATHLPPLRVQHQPLDPDPSYANALRRAHREARDEIARERRNRSGRGGGDLVLNGQMDEDLAAGSEMTAVGMLRALCTSPHLIRSSDTPAAQALVDADIIPDGDGPKLDWIRGRVAEMQEAGERVVIFTYSRRMADLIAERFTEDGIRHVMFTGATSSVDRDTARQRFNDPNDDVCAFIATDAGAEGLNLGKCCSTLINVDIPWTPTRLEQRSNRIHRIDGTADSYLVINLTVRGTIEDGIRRLVEAKADIADSIFGESGGKARTVGQRLTPMAVFKEALDGYFESGADTGRGRSKGKAGDGADTAGDTGAGATGDGPAQQLALLEVPPAPADPDRMPSAPAPMVASDDEHQRPLPEDPASPAVAVRRDLTEPDPVPHWLSDGSVPPAAPLEAPLPAAVVDASEIRSARIRYELPPSALAGGANLRAQQVYGDDPAIAAF